MGLNEESRETSYVLGRLFSVLESIQMDANPGIKASESGTVILIRPVLHLRQFFRC